MGQARRRFLRGVSGGANTQARTPAKRSDGRIGVLLAFPSLTGNLRWSIARMVGQATAYNFAADCPYWFETFYINGARPFEYARNKIVEHFMTTDCEYLYMVDDDQEVPDNWFELLKVEGADVVSGVTVCWFNGPNPAARLRANQYMLDDKGRCMNMVPPAEANGSPYRTAVAGTACMVIRRHVLAKLGPHPFKCRYGDDGRMIAGEDVWFCNEVNKAGMIVAVCQNVVFGHVKAIDLVQVSEMMYHRMRLAKANGNGQVEYPSVIAGFNSGFDTPADVLSVCEGMM